MSLIQHLDEISRQRPLTSEESLSLYRAISKPRAKVPAVVLAILQKIATEHGTTVADMRGPSRLRYIAHARWEAMAALRDRGWSYPRIGTLFRRDHTTIIHGVRAHRERVGVHQ